MAFQDQGAGALLSFFENIGVFSVILPFLFIFGITYTVLLSTKIFDNIKVNVFHPINYDYRVKLKEEYISLSLKGSKLMLDMLNPQDIMAYIDVSSLSPPGPYNQPVICNIPEGLEIEGIPPESHVDIVETLVGKE